MLVEEYGYQYKKKEQDFRKKYGDQWKEVMYATATKLAKEEGPQISVYGPFACL